MVSNTLASAFLFPTPTTGLTSTFADLEALFPVRKTQTGKQALESARQLHQWLEISTAFTTWFNRRVQEYDFEQGKDFLPILKETPGLIGRPETDFAITITMAKELVMVDKTEKSKRFRKYLIDCEEKLREVIATPITPALPTTFAQALRQLAEKVEENDRIQQQLQQNQVELTKTTQQLETTQKQVQEALPAILFHNQLVEAEGLLSLNEVAKKLGFKVRAFFNQLRDDAILMKQDKSNVAMSRYIDAGWFELKTTTYKDSCGKTHVSSTTMVTGKGLIALQRKYSK